MSTKMNPLLQPAAPIVRTKTPQAVEVAAPVAKVDPVKPAAVAPEAFAEGAGEKKAEINPRGAHVNRTADPGALWGEPKATDPLRSALIEFKSLTPEGQKAKIGELKGMQDELSRKMLRRIESLEARYVQSRNVAKGEMLRNLMGETKQLDPTQRKTLDGLLAKAEGLSKQIGELQTKAKAMPRGPSLTAEQKAARTELAAQLREARAQFTAATEASTAYVDGLGLKTDRLAVNEQRLDPSAPPKGSPDSLLSMMDRWFEFDRVIEKLEAIYAPISQAIEALNADAQRQAEQIKKTGDENAKRDADARLSAARLNTERQNAKDRASREAARAAAQSDLASLMRRSSAAQEDEPNRMALAAALARVALNR